jgi:predicted dehydrogenase
LIVNLGGIGRRHLANFRCLAPHADITVWRRRPTDLAIPEGADAVVFSLEDALARAPEVAVLAGPATTHVAAGLALARAGCALFIEKPLSHALDGVEELLSLCRVRRLPLMVGYNLRFHPSLRIVRNAVTEGGIGRVLAIRAEVGQYLPDWRPGSDYRASVSARSDLGGGVALELSHELDYVRWICGPVATVSAEAGKLSDLDLDVEDTMEIILRFSSGALGSVHLDMTQRVPVRQCRVVGTKGSVTWDGLSGEARLYCAEAGQWSTLYPAGDFDRNQMYVDEMAAFLDAVLRGCEPPVSGVDGRAALDIALAAKRSARERRVVEIRE